MKNFITSLALSFGMLLVTTPKSEAIVGAIVSAPAAITIGGVMALAGVGTTTAVGTRVIRCDWDCSLTTAFYGIVATGVGIVVLDGNQAGEIAFAPVNTSSAGHFSKSEIATYNKELTQLNAIQQTITHEVATKKNVDVNARWEVLGAKLSPATIEIAAANGAELLKQLK